MNALWRQLDCLREAGALDPLDLHLARFLVRLDGREDAAVALAAVVVSRTAAAGDVCADLRTVAGQSVAMDDATLTDAPRAPALPEWLAALRGSAPAPPITRSTPLSGSPTG